MIAISNVICAKLPTGIFIHYGQTNMKTPAKLLLFAENVLKSSENEVANP